MTKRNSRLWSVLRHVFLDKWKGSRHYSWAGFHYHRTIFVHVPKTGGVSISRALFGHLGGGHTTAATYQRLLGSHYDRYFRFAFVRNPWDRIYSAYCFLCDGGFDPADEQWAVAHEEQLQSFESFVMEWLTPLTMEKKLHFLPQSHFLKNRAGVVDLDFLGRFEQLEEGFAEVCSQLDVTATLRHHNASRRDSEYRDAYSIPMRNRIAELYAEDVDRFDYEF
ncbi:MAG: sulfotransferase family 2 domain-containing protein [Planctomycetota bacterium]